jgi:hypothetical protein
LNLRFDTGFVGGLPIHAHGPIGRRLFYLLLRKHNAPLTLGCPARHRDAGWRKRDARKARRKLRRGQTEGLMRYIAERDARGHGTTLERHPFRASHYASIWPDTQGVTEPPTLEGPNTMRLIDRAISRLRLRASL